MSPRKPADPWAALDKLLEDNRYMRFSIDTYRNFDDARKRMWNAVLFKENGQLLARAYGDTREEALSGMLKVYGSGVA